MFASCERSWKMIRLSPHICWLTATLVTGSRKGRRKPSRRKAEREAIRLVISEPGGQHVRSKGHLLQICALPHSILEREPNPVVTLEIGPWDITWRRVPSISRYDPEHVEAGRRSARAKTTYANRRGGRRHRCSLGAPLFHVSQPHPLEQPLPAP